VNVTFGDSPGRKDREREEMHLGHHTRASSHMLGTATALSWVGALLESINQAI